MVICATKVQTPVIRKHLGCSKTPYREVYTLTISDQIENTPIFSPKQPYLEHFSQNRSNKIVKNMDLGSQNSSQMANISIKVISSPLGKQQSHLYAKNRYFFVFGRFIYSLGFFHSRGRFRPLCPSSPTETTPPYKV